MANSSSESRVYGSSSSSSSIGSATISGPFRVGISDGDTCSYHALQDEASCRQPRTCYECLNADVAGVNDGCLLSPSGFCENMESYESNLDYRRNTTGEDLSLTGWYNYYPSVNSTYCEPTDEACELCDELVNNGSLGQKKHKAKNVSVEVQRQFCLGTDGCVCVMACETDNWKTNMPAECDANGSASSNHSSSTDATTYSTMLIFYLVLQVALLGVFMYRRGLCRRMPPQRGPSRPEGPYNNVDAITSPSNRLRLSGWRAMQSTLIEREKKLRANQPPYMSSPGLEDQTENSTTATTSTQHHSTQTTSLHVEGGPEATCSRGRNDSFSTTQCASVSSDVVVVDASSYEATETGVAREDRSSSGVAMLEARRDAV